VVAGSAPGDISVQYYDIDGATLAELKAEITRKGPTDKFGVRRDAFAAWHMTWRWPRGSAGEPLYGDTTVNCTGTVTLPRWEPPADSDPSVRSEWQRYIEAMMRHERRHLAHCFAERKNVRAALERAHREDPDLTTEEANRIVRQILKQIHAKDRAYDTATDHGRNEGVRLQLTEANPRQAK
jgi:predicted secreted Zn-dependent protease